MTGYGRADRISQHFLIKTEIKTLNSKFLDFSPRIPKELAPREAEIRNMVTDTLKRGKVMLTMEIEIASDESQNVEVDEKLFKAYYTKFQSLGSSVGDASNELVKLALQAPEVIKAKEISPDDLPWKDIKSSLSDAINECQKFRSQEGETLAKKLQDYIKNIRNGLSVIEKSDENRSSNIRSRLQKAMEEIKEKVKVDENRFEQELIFYLERLDISEEKVRLQQHLDYFEEVITKEKDAGKKLGFISQEIGREINTIGSKANDADIQRTVVMMKDELEKIKEQTLNLI